MTDFKNNCEQRDQRMRREKWILDVASLVGTVAFIIIMGLTQTLFLEAL